MSARKIKPDITISDLFCGAGGTSTGALQACNELGLTAELTAVNHWEIAVATHTVNHKTSRHRCASLDSLNPRDLFEEGELDILWASPECMSHSTARGGKPVNDQSRSTAFCVLRWVDALKPRVVLIENVKEFKKWGPIGSNGRPLKKREGEIYNQWLKMLEALGYRVDSKILCSADYGDPTTRKRLFVQAVRGKHPICWPEATHAPYATVEQGNDLFGSTLKPWVSAREGVIDWTIKGKSIYSRKKPLADKTMRRILIGLEKFGLAPFFVQPGHGNKQYQSGDGCRATSQDVPIGTVVSSNRYAIAVPELRSFILPKEGVHGGNAARSDGSPVPTVIGDGRMYVAQPELVPAEFMLGQQSGGAPRSVNEPSMTVATAGKISLIKAVPYLVQLKGTSDAKDADQPLPGLNAGGKHFAVVEGEGYMVNMKGNSNAADAAQPTPAITAHAEHLAVVQPVLTSVEGDGYIVDTNHGNEKQSDDMRRVKSDMDPLGGVTGTRGKGIVKPWLIAIDHTGGNGNQATSSDKPVTSITTKQRHAVCTAKLEPFTVGVGGPTGQAEPRSVDEAVPTVLTRNNTGVAEPFLIEYYGNGQSHDTNQPCPTATTKQRFGLVQPMVVINGQTYIIDIFFRMLTWRELANAQGFPADYEFTGTQGQKVKQIGNAVSVNLAKALMKAVLGPIHSKKKHKPIEERLAA